ncbi:orf1ab polyprotein [Macroglossus bat coronavirus]|nr:orf1ab polyprotein [Macroglossus bat coronavirus]
MEGALGTNKLRSMVSITLDWIDPRNVPRLTNWEMPLQEAAEYVKRELSKPNPDVVFVPNYLLDSAQIPQNRVVITNSVWRCYEMGWKPVREIAFDLDGVRFGRGGTHGVLLPRQPPQYICGTVSIELRKYGVGGGAEIFIPKLWDGFVDPPAAAEEYLDFPDKCFPTKPKAKRGGNTFLTDQYGFDADGVLAAPIKEVLGDKGAGMSLVELTKFLGKYRTADGYELPSGIVKVAVKVVRKNLPVSKQSIFTVLGVTERVVDGFYYPYSTNSVVSYTKPRAGATVGNTVQSVMLSMYGTEAYNPVTPVVRLRCSSCDFYGWVPVKDLGCVTCSCAAVHQITSSCIDAESAGLIKQGAVMLVDRSPSMRVVPGNRLYVAFGGAIWSPIGKVNGVQVWVPRAYSCVAGDHSGAVGSGDVNTINKEIMSLIIDGVRIDDEVLEQPSCGVLIANLEDPSAAPRVHTVDSLRQLCVDNNVMLGDTPLPKDEFHPGIVGLSYHFYRACWYGVLTAKSFCAFKELLQSEEVRLSHFCANIRRCLDRALNWARTTGNVSLLSSSLVLKALAENLLDSVKNTPFLVGDLVKPVLDWIVEKMVLARDSVVSCAEAVLSLFNMQFTFAKGKFTFLKEKLNKSCVALRELLTVIVNKFATTVKWAGCKIDGFYNGDYHFFSAKGVLTEVQVCAKTLGAMLTPRQQRMEVEVLDGKYDAPVAITVPELEELNGTLEEVFGFDDLTLVRGSLVALASKVFVRTDDGLLFRYVKSGGVFLKAFRLRGGGKPKVSFGEEEVRTVPRVLTVNFTYDVCEGLDGVLNKLMAPFEVEEGTKLEDLALVVQEAVAEKLRELFEDCPADVRPIDIDAFADDECYIYNMDYEKVLSTEMYFSLEDVTPVEDEDECASEVQSSDDCEEQTEQFDESDDDTWLGADDTEAEADVSFPVVEGIPEASGHVPPENIADDHVGFKQLTANVFIKCADIVQEAKSRSYKVLVNAANVNLHHGGGVAGVLNRASDNAMQAESTAYIREHGPLQPGNGVLLSGHGLAQDGILHVVGPDKRLGQSLDTLGQVYQLYNAHDDILTPLVSAGIFGFTVEESLVCLCRNVTAKTFVVVYDKQLYSRACAVSRQDLEPAPLARKEACVVAVSNDAQQESQEDDWAAAVEFQEKNHNVEEVVGGPYPSGDAPVPFAALVDAKTTPEAPCEDASITTPSSNLKENVEEEVAACMRFLLRRVTKSLKSERRETTNAAKVTVVVQEAPSAEPVVASSQSHLKDVLCMSFSQMIQYAKSHGLLTPVVLDYTAFSKVLRKYEPKSGLYEFGGQKFYGYSRETPLEDVSKALNELGLPLIMIPFGYIVNGAQLSLSAINMRMLQVEHTVVLPSESCVPLYRNYYVSGITQETTALQDFVVDIVVNGAKGWDVVQTVCKVDGVTYKTICKYRDTYMCHDESNLYAITGSTVLKFATLQKARGYMESSVKEKKTLTKVLTTVDGVNYSTVLVDDERTFQDQIGVVFHNGVDISSRVPNSDDANIQLFKQDNFSPEEVQAISDYYGVNDCTVVARALSVRRYVRTWPYSVVDGRVLLAQRDSNCYLNAAISVLQDIEVEFSTPWISTAFDALKGGNPLPIVEVLITLGKTTIGEPDDAHMILSSLLSYASVKAARRAITTVCENCGSSQEIIEGVPACLHYGTVQLDDLYKPESIVCPCGKAAIRFVSLQQTPWVLMSHVPTNVPLDTTGNWFSAVVFKGPVTCGHYMYAVNGSLISVYDANTRKRTSDLLVPATDILYKDVNFTTSSKVVTFYLDGVKLTQIDPDLTQYVKRGDYYFTKAPIDVVAAPKVVTPYDGFRLVSDQASELAEAFNKAINASSDGPKRNLTVYPDCSGDAVVVNEEIPSYAHGALIQGKPVLYPKKPKTWKKLVPLLSVLEVKTKNRFEALPVDQLPEQTVEVVKKHKVVTEPLYGLTAPIVLDGVNYVPGKKGDLLCLKEFTITDLKTFYVEGNQPFVLLKENHLSKLLGLKISSNKLVVNKISSALILSYGLSLKSACAVKCATKKTLRYGAQATANCIRETKPGAKIVGILCMFYRVLLHLWFAIKKPPLVKVSGIVAYNTGCSVTACVFNYLKARFSNTSWTGISRVLRLLLYMWFTWTCLAIVGVWVSEPYAPSLLTKVKQYFGFVFPCDYLIVNETSEGWFHHMCMSGMDGLDYPALKMQQRRYGSPYDWTYMVMFLEAFVAYLLYTPVLPLVGIIGCLHALVLYLPISLGNSWLVVFFYYFVKLIPLSSLLRMYIVSAFLWLCYKGFVHVRYGCTNVSCLMCYKRNIATRVECSTVVNGVKRVFYVNANGGTYYCTKHNWNCVNCDTYTVDSTFISRPVALDLSAQFKRPINHTDEAYYEVTSVQVRNGYVYCYFDSEGEQSYERFPVDSFTNVSKLYYSELKGNPPAFNVLIFDATNRIEENAVKTAAIYYSQLACKPILLVDKRMVGVVGDDTAIAKTMFEAYAQSYLLKYNIAMDKVKSLYATALQQIASGTSVEAVLKVFVGSTREEARDLESDVDTNELVSCIRMCHQDGWEWTTASWNNLVPTYLKQETLSTLEVGQLITSNARYINANMAKSAAVQIVWRYADFARLSESVRRQLKIAARKTGLSLQLTTSNLKADVACVVTPFKVVGGNKRVIPWRSILVHVLMLLVVLNPQWFTPWYTMTAVPYDVIDFKVIDNAILRDIVPTDTCFANKFETFDNWYHNRFGTYENNWRCPMVVGVVKELVGVLKPDLPVRFVRVGTTLLPVVNFGMSGADSVCYTPYSAISYSDFETSACVLAATCTLFTGVGGQPAPYCADPTLIPNATHYGMLKPHVLYPFYETAGYIRFPEVIDAGVHIVKLMAMEYCKVGRCDVSEAGVCVTLTPMWVVNNPTFRQLPGVYCGASFMDMILQVFTPMFTPVGAVDITGSIIMGACLAVAISMVLYYLLKFRRAFGDYSSVVLVNILAFAVNVLVLCLEGAYPMLPSIYALLFLYVTCYFSSDVAAIMHVSFLVMFTSVIPLWVTMVYVVVLCSRHALWFAGLCTKRTVQVGDLSFHSFHDAALQTFMLDKEKFLRLKRELSPDAYARYLALFPKYKYYNGPMDTAAYREAACAHLVMALEKFSTGGGDSIYQPPRCSVAAATLQAGLAKMAHPSGLVEPCIVKVSYGTMTLNGVWLNNYVLCPRHVLCTRDDLVNPDYQRLSMRAANYDFHVSQNGLNLRVTGHVMEGALLRLTVDATNPKTPAHSFVRVSTGQAISILACYDGIPAGVYTCTLRANGTLRAAFLCGSCGSPGFAMNGKEVQFCYLHQLELPNGTHTGTDMHGAFYGPFEDKQVPQLASPDVTITVNVLAWLYAAVLSGESWFVTKLGITAAEFNTSAVKYMCQSVTEESLQVLQPLAAKTGVSVQRMLSSLKVLLSTGFCGKTIMGSCSLEDEHTPYDIGRQMLGVTLQSRTQKFVKWAMQWFLIVFALSCLTLLHLSQWTVLGALPLQLLLPLLGFISCCVGFMAMFIKHKHTFLTVYLLPVVMVAAYYNFQYQPEGIQGYLLYVYNYVNPGRFDMGFDLTTMLVISGITTLLSVRIAKSDTYSRVWYVCTAIGWVYNCCTGTAETIALSYLTFVVSVFTNYTGVACISVYVSQVIVWAMAWVEPGILMYGHFRCVLVCYVIIGYCCTCYFGVFNLLNRLFRCTLGTYDYVVSSQELRYMNSNGLSPPTNSWQAMVLNLKLAGIGGVPMYKVATIQSNMTDLKCTSVVLLSVLQQLHVESSSKLWSLCVKLHNEILAATSTTEAFEAFVSLLSVLLSLPGAINLDELCNSILENNTVLQAVASEFSNLSSYVDYENAQKAYDTAVTTGAPASTIKALKKAMNVAKSVLDKDVATARKLERMSEMAMTAMYKQARAEDKRSKVTSAMQTMLFNMIRRLDSDALNSILTNARNGIVPLGVIPRTAANKLLLVVPDYSVFSSTVVLPTLTYAGSAWDVTQVSDADGKNVNVTDITRENSANLAWPLVITAVRQVATSPVKLQNNELMPQAVKRMAVTAGISQTSCTTDTVAYYNASKEGRHVMAILADVDGLLYAKVEKSTGDGFVILELEPPCKFMIETPKGPALKYLYFTKGLKNLCRGTVLGALACTVRLHAGSATEVASNSAILSLCAFSVDPEATYKDYLDNGGTPIGNCVKMLTTHTGTGLALTAKPDASIDQESFGGASCCIYCRCHIEHPGASGVCKFKGKFVQIPLCGVPDPVGFCIRNVICSVCNMWQGYGCPCASLREVSLHANDDCFLNRVRGASGVARLVPQGIGVQPDVVLRAFDICNSKVAGFGLHLKNNCCRYQELDSEGNKLDSYFVVKRHTEENYALEQRCYDKLKDCDVVARHDFFKFKVEGVMTPHISRQRLTKYTMADLVYSLRHFDNNNCEILKEILVMRGCCDEEFFTKKDWFDPVETPELISVYHKLGETVRNAVLSANKMADAMVKAGLVGVLTLDNQDLNGKWYDFGDFIEAPPGTGVAVMDTYYSLAMPVYTMTNMLAAECHVDGDLTKPKRVWDLCVYDYTQFKYSLFQKYFKYWDMQYHPNCVACPDDRCILHCANFNILFSMVIPNTSFGPLVQKVYVDGVPFVVSTGYHYRELGVVINQDIKVHSQRLSLKDLLVYAADPAMHIAASHALADKRTVCMSVAAMTTGVTFQTVKPGQFNEDFYKFAVKCGFFKEGSSISFKHFFYAQDGNAAISDYDYYRYNLPTMCDIKQLLFSLEVVDRYFDCYEGGCLQASQVVVANYDKSAGFPFNKFGKARLYYESLSYEDQDELFAYTKRNVLPTVTQMNLKYAISAKNRARTVAGVSIASTMTNRQFHQKILKSIAAARGASVVIGTTKFYGGWNRMLRTLCDGVEKPHLMGWDYPKCDRAMPNLLRIFASLILARKHSTCCNTSERFYRLANECAQVLSEIVLCGGGFYVKPGGTSSGDSTTAYANSVFNICQAVSANLNTFLSRDGNKIYNSYVQGLQRRLYLGIYRTHTVDMELVTEYYNYLRKHFSMMILSDDGVVCYNSDYASKGYVADIQGFKELLYYQNNVFMSEAKCWVEPDITKGPHEFCSQHTMLVDMHGEQVYLPYPDPSRILGAGCFVDDLLKTDGTLMMERYVSLAIDAYPLTKHHDAEYQNVFWCYLQYIKKLHEELTGHLLDTYSVMLASENAAKYWEVEFYENMYTESATLQSVGTCVVCSSQTSLRCGACIRRPFLCCKCCYDHVVSTTHKLVLSVTPYVCNNPTCDVADVTQLYLGGMSYYCKDHKPVISFPLCANGQVFGLYKNICTGSNDVIDFNSLATCDWSNSKDYVLANTASERLKLFAAETLRATEENAKQAYASATVKEVLSERELVLSWEVGKTRPPLNRNYVFTGFHITKNSRIQLGEYIFEKGDYGDVVTYRASTTYRLQVGDYFVLTSHSVQALSSPTLLPQERYTKLVGLYPALNVPEAFVTNVVHYQRVGMARYTTVQGPPGTGKSHLSIGLALYYPSAKIVYTACSHAAVDALCEKALKHLPINRCSRIVPAKARVECFNRFKVNDVGSQYVFSTINALPETTADILVVDEVSMCTNYDLSMINARVRAKHIVYVGDPAQLPAPRTLLTKGTLAPEHFNSVCRIMVAVGPDIFLATCYRCPKEIVDTVSALVYDNKLKANKGSTGECFKCYYRGSVTHDASSAINRPQLNLVKEFLTQNPKWQDAVFISPYNSQNAVARRMLGLQTQTVDSSQGSEFDYVIYCQTSDTAHALNANRFNVAITRAKKGILCVMSDSTLYDALDFVPMDVTQFIEPKTQSVAAVGLFKDCSKSEQVGPAYAPTFVSVNDKFKLNESMCAHFDTNEVQMPYIRLISVMGFRFDLHIPGYSKLFITREQAIREVRGWIGFDVEGTHACGPNVGTNLPLQIGFSTGVNFVVTPAGFVDTDSGSRIAQIPSKPPPGDQFKHLIPLLRKGEPWSVIRKRIVEMLCDTLDGVSDTVTFVTWAHGFELTTLHYFVKIGKERSCFSCKRRATLYSSVYDAYACWTHHRHIGGADYVYNPFLVDVQQWGYVGNLQTNHDAICDVHKGAHVASCDAIMTRCLAIHDCFCREVNWDIEYPIISNELAINKSCRVVQRLVLKAVTRAMHVTTIYDIGNPKAIRVPGVDVKRWKFYDCKPIANGVETLHYSYAIHKDQFADGLTMFWNCNVDCYPNNALVCRFDTRVLSKLNLAGCNGGSLYVNQHAFHTSAYNKSAFVNLKPLPFFFYSDTPCENAIGMSTDFVCDVDYVPLKSNVCITRCNLGGAVCKKHADEYRQFLEFYNTMVSAGFTLWVDKKFDVFNLWSTFTKLQSLENVAYNVVKSSHYTAIPGELPVAIVNDKLYVKDEGYDKLLFTNKTCLPTNVAFELWAKRSVKVVPECKLLRHLGVTCTYKQVLWDYENEAPIVPCTIGVCNYTDLAKEVSTEVQAQTVLIDGRDQDAYSKFCQLNNAVYFSPQKPKCAAIQGPPHASINGVVIEAPEKGTQFWYAVRRNGEFVQLSDTLFTQSRTLDDFEPRSEMETDFLNLSQQDFLVKYDLEGYGLEHIAYGQFESVIGGLHLLIGVVLRKKVSDIRLESVLGNDTVTSYAVVDKPTAANKQVCSVFDVLLDDFVALLKEQDRTVVSKVVQVTLDFKVYRFMLWCKDGQIATFYPQLQSKQDWKPGYSMPALYKVQNAVLEPCLLHNYGQPARLPYGTLMNVAKYTQLCQYLNTCTLSVPAKMRVMHFGAGSDKGVCPGTSVLKQWLPTDALLVDNDLDRCVSDANYTFVGNCELFSTNHKWDLVISDMYDARTKQVNGDNISKEGFFTYLTGFIKSKLALGGSIAVKITEHSWNADLYAMMGHFGWWTCFCTSVNSSSSEAFLIGINYLGRGQLLDGDQLHANYVFWRNSTLMQLSSYSLYDLQRFSLRAKGTPVMTLNESQLNELVLNLLKAGRLLIRDVSDVALSGVV